MTPKHRAAREWAEAGIPVFPTISDEAGRGLPDGEKKRPATSRGFKDATTNLEQIDEWWSHDDYNLAISPDDAGWCVLDSDPRHGARPIEGLPATRIVRTPSGGEHYYYQGSLPPSAGKLAQGWDTRGRGSYVLIPPSTIGGKAYEWTDERDIADLPAWVSNRLENAVEQRLAAADVEEDLPGNIDRGVAFLRARVARGDVPRAGSRNDTAYQLAASLRGLAISEATANSLIAEHWNVHGQPPLDNDELIGIVEHAYTYAQNAPGVDAVPPAEEAFTAALTAGAVTPEANKRSRFYAEDDEEMDRTPPVNWLVPGLLQQRSLAMLYGDQGAYKTFLALDLGLGVATNLPALGVQPEITGPVFYATNEGIGKLKRERRMAWRNARQVEGVTQFYVMRAPLIASGEEVVEFLAEMKTRLNGRWPALIIIETVSKMMVGLDPTRDAPKFIKFQEDLVDAFGCTVLSIHHVGHDDSKGPRDAYAYQAGVDTLLLARAHKASRAVEVFVKKHKDHEEPSAPYTFIGKPISGSLVFDPIAREEHAKLTAKIDPLSPNAVGTALLALGAVAQDVAVVTAVLAEALTPQILNEGAEQRLAAIERTERELRKRTKHSLRAYVEPHGRDLLWFVTTV